MKKILTLALVLMIILLNFGCASFAVKWCSIYMVECDAKHDEKIIEEFEATFETDGVFKYHLFKEQYFLGVYNEEGIDAYAVVGTVDDLSNTTLYIPPYFNGKPVVMIGWEFGYGFMEKKVYCLPEQKCIYYPYTLSSYDHYSSNEHEKAFVHNVNRLRGNVKTYCSRNDFEKRFESLYEQGKYYCDRSDDFRKRIIIIANTAFMFNYEDAPNDGYFFINDFERGGLIENTPYEPTREGYVFVGWYKEPECITPWNFETDTLPEAEYDENGELVFVETILYAGWNKI